MPRQRLRAASAERRVADRVAIERRRLAPAAGPRGGLAVGLGEAEVGRGDSIQIEGPLPFMQLTLAPAYRVSPAFAVGLRASYGVGALLH